MSVLAFMCTGPDACRVKTPTVWIIGATWVILIALATHVLDRQPDGIIVKLIAWVGAVIAASYFCFLALFVASIDPRF